MKKLNIIGAGGHSRSLISLLKLMKYEINAVYDDSYHPDREEMILGIPLSGNLKDLSIQMQLVLAIGDNVKREKLFHQFRNQLLIENVIHPTAVVASTASMGNANMIFANTLINAAAIIGSNTIINSGAIIEHECTIGSHTHIAVHTTITGRCTIGKRCFIGAGATVIDKVKICDDVIVGAGGVVIRDIVSPGTYVGNPVKKL